MLPEIDLSQAAQHALFDLHKTPMRDNDDEDERDGEED